MSHLHSPPSGIDQLPRQVHDLKSTVLVQTSLNMSANSHNSNPATDPHEGRSGKLVTDVKSTIQGIKGAGDAIRGTAMEAVDSAAKSKEGEARNHAIAEKGAIDFKSADQRFGERRAEHHTTGPAAGLHDTTTPATTGERMTQGRDGALHDAPRRPV